MTAYRYWITYEGRVQVIDLGPSADEEEEAQRLGLLSHRLRLDDEVEPYWPTIEVEAEGEDVEL